MKAFQAYGTDGTRVTRPTPKEAAIAFFEQNEGKRKCNVVEGKVDGHFFTVSYGRASAGNWPQSWKNVTKKSAQELPES
jgi:hypothetical protein